MEFFLELILVTDAVLFRLLVDLLDDIFRLCTLEKVSIRQSNFKKMYNDARHGKINDALDYIIFA